MSLRVIARKSVGIINPCMRQLHVSRLMKDTFTHTDAVLAKPQQTKIIGYFAASVAVCAGVTAGAQMSKNIAILLEENELFVPSDDDDDD